MLRLLAAGLACVCFLQELTGSPARADDNAAGPMQFEWRREGPPQACGSTCRTWILRAVRTRMLPPAADGAQYAVLAPDSHCESMCAFLLLAGTRRHVPPQAQVLVHQIWLGQKRKTALESSYSAEELNVVQRDIGRLAQYTIEMGGDIELLERALQVPPWEPLHLLSAAELERMRLSTVAGLFIETPQRMAPTAAAGATFATVGQPTSARD